MLRFSRPVLVVCALISSGLVHCGRKTDTAERQRQQSASAPAASVAAPLAASADVPQSTASAVTSAVPAAASAGALPNVTAEALRARIRGSGAKGTIVNAWASWCGPCRDEVPLLQSLARNLKAQRIDVILVSVDEPEDSPKATAFLQNLDIRLPAFLAERPLGSFKLGIYPRWPGMIPATFLFDADGRARYFWGGPVEEHEILAIVDGFLAGKAIDGESDFTIAPGRVERQP